MKHFYCDFRVQHLNLHKNWHISFPLVVKSEILYISVIGGFCKTIFPQILNRNTWRYCHLKEECSQFHSDLKCTRCAPHVWHGRCPVDTPIPAKLSQACLVWRSRLRCWCALAILVVFAEVVGRKHCPWRNPAERNHTLSGLVTGVARCRRWGSHFPPTLVYAFPARWQ